MKDQIHNLVVINSTTCFIPQGTGVKVCMQDWKINLVPSRYECLHSLMQTLYLIFCSELYIVPFPSYLILSKNQIPRRDIGKPLIFGTDLLLLPI
jgi:hypothetical protein